MSDSTPTRAEAAKACNVSPEMVDFVVADSAAPVGRPYRVQLRTGTQLYIAGGTVASSFDPADYSVALVIDYLNDADDAERHRVLKAERAGKARVTILERED